MTIDDMIKKLQEAREVLGGDTPVVISEDENVTYLEVTMMFCDGDDDMYTKHVEISASGCEVDVWKDQEDEG